MSPAIYLTRSRPENLASLESLVRLAAIGILRGQILTDHVTAKPSSEEAGPEELGYFEESFLGIRADFNADADSLQNLEYPFKEAFREFDIILTMHMDRIKFALLPTHSKTSAVEISFQTSEDGRETQSLTTRRGICEFLNGLADAVGSARPLDDPLGIEATRAFEDRAKIYAILGFIAFGREIDVHLLSGDYDGDDIVLSDADIGRVVFNPDLRIAMAEGNPLLRQLSADPDGIIQMFDQGVSVAWDGVLRGTISRHGVICDGFTPNAITSLRVGRDWGGKHLPHATLGHDRDGGTDDDANAGTGR